MRSVFLTIGGSRRNRNGYWRAGWAVYYGRDSFNNSSGVIPDSLPQSASFAEIQALKHALISIRNLLAIGYWFSNIHIRTTSTYLADMMAGGLEDCVLNGWKHEDGTYLEHTESWEWIRELLRYESRSHFACTNLWSDTYACVSVIGFTPTSTTAKATKTAGNGIITPAPVHEGIASNCNKFHLVEEGDSCAAIAKRYGIRASDIVSWNGLNSGCTNLWGDTYACVSIVGFKPTTTAKTVTTTAAGNGIQTPQPTQPGMVDNCNKFHIIGEKTTCQGIASYNKIELADFFKWNPEVDKGCTNLWLGAYACAGVIGSTPKPTTTAKPTVTQPGNGISTPTPIQAGMVSNCNKFHIIGSTTTCQGIIDYNKITMANFKKWNTGINSACSNLWLGSYACVGVIGGTSPAPTTTKPAGGIVTPTPTQAGMVKGCTKFHEVRTTTTCQGILNYNKITLAEFVKWNPAVGKDCSTLWSGTHACVAGP
ncbi:hypothetical protein FSOLCH5_003490 [Fusarium solani]